MNYVDAAKRFVEIHKRLKQLEKERRELILEEKTLIIYAKTGAYAWGWRLYGKHTTDGGMRWAVFHGRIEEDKLLEKFNEAGIDWSRYYGGPGRPFRGFPMVVHKGSRTLITQRFGYDI